MKCIRKSVGDRAGKQGNALHFVAEAFKHGKAIGATGAGVQLLQHASIPGLSEAQAGANGGVINMHGVVMAENTSNLQSFTQQFADAIAQHRHWTRPQTEQVPA